METRSLTSLAVATRSRSLTVSILRCVTPTILQTHFCFITCAGPVDVAPVDHTQRSVMMTFRRRLGKWVTCGGLWWVKWGFSCLRWPDQSQRGSLFTLFLYSPLLAFSSVCGLNSVRAGLWERAQEFLRKVYRDIGQMITRSRTIGM